MTDATIQLRCLLRALGAALLVLSGLRPAVAAGPGPTDVWDELVVPGGVGGVSAAVDLPPSIQRARIVLEVVRRLYGETDADPVDIQARLQQYLDLVQDFTAALDSVSNGTRELRLETAMQPANRSGLVQLLRLAGLRLRQDQEAYRVSADPSAQDRRELLQAAGVDIDAAVERLNRGEAVPLAVRQETAPLPLGGSLWLDTIVVPSNRPPDLFRAIVTDRSAALLYHGLASLDDRTLAFLEAHPDILESLYLEHAGVFATLGRSLRVTGSRMDVPGGETAVPLWESLVGARVSDPAAFFTMLLGRDFGRLALLYDTVAHLDAVRAHFTLGLAHDGTTRLARFTALYEAFLTTNAEWQLPDQPFRRPSVDPTFVLRHVRVDDSGVPISPAWQPFWPLVFSDTRPESLPAGWIQGLAVAPPVDAAYLAATICEPTVLVQRQRLRTLLFAQRVFSSASPEQVPDLIVTLQAYRRYPSLLLTLERLGLADPAIYAAAVRRADRLMSIRDRSRRVVALTQFQAALALVEVPSRKRVFAPAVVRALVTSLVELELDEDTAYAGRVAAWIDTTLLPEISTIPNVGGSRAGLAAPLEETLLDGLAGLSSPTRRPVTLTWEGLEFRADPARADRNRLARVRVAQKGNTLDVVLEVSRALVALQQARTLEQRTALTARVEAAAAELVEREVALPGTSAPDSIREEIAQRLREIRALRPPAGAGDGAGRITSLLTLGDLLVADVLASLTYAAHLGDPSGLTMLAGDVARRHDLGLEARIEHLRQSLPWDLPREEVGQRTGWHVTGSLLGLDLGLSRLALRRTGVGMPSRPTLNDSERQTFIFTVALMTPDALTDQDRHVIADSVARGRRRVGGLTADHPDIGGITGDVGLSEWRAQELSWTLEHDRERIADFFSLGELFWLGRPDRTRPLDAWGTAAVADSGCYCLTLPRPGAWEEFTGRRGMGLLATRIPDLALRVAELLAELDLPAALAPGVMAAAMQDFVDEVQLAHHSDWWAIVEHPRRLSRERMEDYVATLVAGGGLISMPRPAEDRDP